MSYVYSWQLRLILGITFPGQVSTLRNGYAAMKALANQCSGRAPSSSKDQIGQQTARRRQTWTGFGNSEEAFPDSYVGKQHPAVLD